MSNHQQVLDLTRGESFLIEGNPQIDLKEKKNSTEVVFVVFLQQELRQRRLPQVKVRVDIAGQEDSLELVSELFVDSTNDLLNVIQQAPTFSNLQRIRQTGFIGGGREGKKTLLLRLGSEQANITTEEISQMIEMQAFPASLLSDH